MNKIRVLATGPEFMKQGLRGTGPVMEEMIRSAKSEVHVMAYHVSPYASKFLEQLEKAAQRGVKIRMVINKLDEHEEDVIERLNKMKKAHEYVRISSFRKPAGELHAKVLVVDRKKAVVGSANFSFGGLARNYEIGVGIEGDVAWQLAKLIDDFVEKFKDS
jgi:cardiolipin synthase